MARQTRLDADNSALYRSAAGYQAMMAHYDAALQGIGVDYERRFAETSQGRAHAIVCGNETGRPVVLWHGQNGNAATWAAWLRALAPAWHLYAIDVIGGTGRSAPSRPDKKGPAYGQWAAEVLGAFGLEQANMLGASQGAWLILKLGSVAPGMVGSAVLLSSAGLLPLSLKAILRTMRRVLFKAPPDAAYGLAALLAPPGVAPDPDTVALFELMLRHFRSEPNVPAIRDEELRHFTAPVALLMGQYEATFDPFRALERGLGLLPNVVSAEIVPGVGHAMVHQQPDWVIARAVNFLERYALPRVSTARTQTMEAHSP